MIRPLAALALFALGLNVAMAQEAPQIVVDPAANLNTSPKQHRMLTGFYATQAVIDICELTIAPEIVAGMSADRQRLETALGMDAPTGAKAYAAVKTDVETTRPDCSEGSADRLGVDAVTSIYARLPTASPPAETPAQ